MFLSRRIARYFENVNKAKKTRMLLTRSSQMTRDQTISILSDVFSANMPSRELDLSLSLLIQLTTSPVDSRFSFFPHTVIPLFHRFVSTALDRRLLSSLFCVIGNIGADQPKLLSPIFPSLLPELLSIFDVFFATYPTQVFNYIHCLRLVYLNVEDISREEHLSVYKIIKQLLTTRNNFPTLMLTLAFLSKLVMISPMLFAENFETSEFLTDLIFLLDFVSISKSDFVDEITSFSFQILISLVDRIDSINFSSCTLETLISVLKVQTISNVVKFKPLLPMIVGSLYSKVNKFPKHFILFFAKEMYNQLIHNQELLKPTAWLLTHIEPINLYSEYVLKILKILIEKGDSSFSNVGKTLVMKLLSECHNTNTNVEEVILSLQNAHLLEHFQEQIRFS
ncbi:hypothetical protein P9112_002754 [Eukaryota sp. TZLM1-RC]